MLITRIAFRLALGAVLASVVAEGSACGRPVNTRESVAPTLLLVVTNNGFYDVNVYAVPDGDASAVRLGTVSGMSSQTFHVREMQLQTGERLVLQLHAIGTSADWQSPSVMVDDRSVALLDVYTAPSGDMRMSALHLRANR